MKIKGFTLVELLAVIIVLGLLIVIAVPQAIKLINNSKDSAWQKDVISVKNSIELYSNTLDSSNDEYKKVSSLCMSDVASDISKLAKVENIDIDCSQSTENQELYIFNLIGKNNYKGRGAIISCTDNGVCDYQITTGNVSSNTSNDNNSGTTNEEEEEEEENPVISTDLIASCSSLSNDLRKPSKQKLTNDIGVDSYGNVINLDYWDYSEDNYEIILNGFNEDKEAVDSNGNIVSNFPMCIKLSGEDDYYEVVEIAESAFEDEEISGTVHLPMTIQRINVDAFKDNDNLSFGEINIEYEGYIATSAFDNIDSIDKLTYDGTRLNGIFGNGCNNESIDELVVESNVQSIGSRAFDSCNLKTLSLDSHSLKKIGESAFEDNEDLQIDELDITSTMKVSSSAFENINSINNLIIRSNSEIGDWSFMYLNTINNLYIDGTIGSDIFGYGGCSGDTTIKDVSIGSNVSSIPSSAFSSCGIENLDLNGGSLTEIGDYAFEYNKIEELEIPNTVTVIGDHAFSDNNVYYDYVSIPSSVISMSNAFEGNNINYLYHNSNVAFGYIDSIYRLEIGNSVTSIPNESFYNSTIYNLELGNSVQTIGDRAFAGNEFSNVTLPNSLTTIGDSAFKDCEISSIIIPSNVTSIGSEAFIENDPLYEITNNTNRAFNWCNILDGCASLVASVTQCYTDSTNCTLKKGLIKTTWSLAYDGEIEIK